MAVSAEAEDFLISKGWDEKYGARPLKRAIERELEDNIAEEILRGSIVDGGGEIKVDLASGGGRLEFSQKREDRRLRRRRAAQSAKRVGDIPF